ncbi:MAG TPA: DUF177 domain-containing protein [Acidimicrobiia bacterium]
MTPLRIDVADLLAHPGARREEHRTVTVTGMANSASRVPDGEQVVLDVVLERVPDGIVVRGTITTAWEAECSVCLAGISRPLTVVVSELFEPHPLEGDTYPLEGHEIDLDQLVRDTVVLELPLAPTCGDEGTESCAGADDGDETPEPAEPPDPRWAALSELDL